MLVLRKFSFLKKAYGSIDASGFVSITKQHKIVISKGDGITHGVEPTRQLQCPKASVNVSLKAFIDSKGANRLM